MERRDERVNIEVFLEGKWNPRAAILPDSIVNRLCDLEKNQSISIADEDDLEIFIRNDQSIYLTKEEIHQITVRKNTFE